MSDWADEHGIKPGSRVVVCESTRTGGGVSKRLVMRMTKMLIVLDNDRRFKRSDGREYGNGSDDPWRVPARLTVPEDPYVADQLALRELKRLTATLKQAASGHRGRNEVLAALRTMRHEIRLTWEKLGGNDTGPLED